MSGLKLTGAQAVFSFKLRGAYNRIAQLDEEQRSRGVICSSAGNHAQGVSLAAQRLVRHLAVHRVCSVSACRLLGRPLANTGRRLVLMHSSSSTCTGLLSNTADRCPCLQGINATICMPESTPAIKVDAVRALGGHVQLVGESYSETQAVAQACSVLLVLCFCFASCSALQWQSCHSQSFLKQPLSAARAGAPANSACSC